jgi:hypothetical protein
MKRLTTPVGRQFETYRITGGTGRFEEAAARGAD